MTDATHVPLARGTFRATISGVGHPGPIEERVGRRLIRVVHPDSREGAALARAGVVRWFGPEGDCLGRLELGEVRRLLRERFVRRLDTVHAEQGEALRDGLARLNRRSRVGRS